MRFRLCAHKRVAYATFESDLNLMILLYETCLLKTRFWACAKFALMELLFCMISWRNLHFQTCGGENQNRLVTSSISKDNQTF